MLYFHVIYKWVWFYSSINIIICLKSQVSVRFSLILKEYLDICFLAESSDQYHFVLSFVSKIQQCSPHTMTGNEEETATRQSVHQDSNQNCNFLRDVHMYQVKLVSVNI